MVDDDTLVRIIEENTYTDKKVYTMIDLTNYKVGCHYFKEKLQKKIFLWDKIARPRDVPKSSKVEIVKSRNRQKILTIHTK